VTVRLLLDTHTLVWAKVMPSRLSPAARSAVSDADNEVWVSLASAWELCVKARLGKLHASFDALIGSDVTFRERLEESGFDLLPILPAHVFETRFLPLHHRDPFDRMLVAQARTEGLTLVTRDPELGVYGIPIIAA